jgi:type II secretory pathway component PulK
MPAVIILVVLLVFAALGLFLWRWLEIVERVRIERVHAQGQDLILAVEDLARRVEKIEGYISGEDYKKGDHR